MQTANPWKSYRQVTTTTAPPGQIILMLFEGALLAMERALLGFEVKDPAESNMTIHNNLRRAQDIIRALNGSLNMAEGGDFSVTLRRLYVYFGRRLHESNMQKDQEGIREVIRHMTVLRDAWATMLKQNPGHPRAGEPSDFSRS